VGGDDGGMGKGGAEIDLFTRNYDIRQERVWKMADQRHTTFSCVSTILKQNFRWVSWKDVGMQQ
jgi:hypothetical protein